MNERAEALARQGRQWEIDILYIFGSRAREVQEWVAGRQAELPSGSADRSLPLGDQQKFFSDTRNVWTAEACLRRGLEALFDLGRHILAKGFGKGVTEYKEIAAELKVQGVLSQDDAELLRTLAGYRNRLVHFYHATVF
jgi:hypothetical protein